MIKLLIFDMDGTLIELKDVHYEALNRALEEVDPKYVINREDHENRFDGLPTKQKLYILTEERGLPINEHERVWNRKQEITTQVIEDTLQPDLEVNETLRKLKEDGYQIMVASNSIDATVKAALEKTGIINHVDHYLSNENVIHAKPDPEMFELAMEIARCGPVETMIFEDSKYGIEAANKSGAYLYEVKDSGDIRYEPIKFRLDYIQASKGFYR